MLAPLLFKVTPIGKPRMTRRDVWKKRLIVQRYYVFKDELNLQARAMKYAVGEILFISFYLPMPDSWSKKKQALMAGTKHQQKPDIDNLLKGFMDALAVDDAYIWQVMASKYWSAVGEPGRIEVYESKAFLTDQTIHQET